MEPSHPVDPLAEQARAIPQARRSVDPSNVGSGPTHVGSDEAREPSGQDEPSGRSEVLHQAGAPRTGAVHDNEATEPGAVQGSEAAEPGAVQGGGAAEPGAIHGGEAGAAQKRLPGVWNVRSILLLVLAVVMGLGTAGLITGYYLYDKATEPDRSTPSLVTRQYIDAVYNDRDRRVASRFTCGDPSDVAGGEQLLDEIKAREQAHSVRIVINAEEVRERVTGKAATVTAQLRLATVVNGRTQEQLQHWTFSLTRRSGGWRVCEAARTS